MTRYEWYVNKFCMKDLLADQLHCTCCVYMGKCNIESRCKHGIKEWLDQEVVDENTGDFPEDTFAKPWWWKNVRGE